MKLEVKYFFPTSSSGAHFYIYQLPEGLEMRKILTHGIKMHFLDFHEFSWSCAGPMSNLYPRTELSSITSLTPKPSIA